MKHEITFDPFRIIEDAFGTRRAIIRASCTCGFDRNAQAPVDAGYHVGEFVGLLLEMHEDSVRDGWTA